MVDLGSQPAADAFTAPGDPLPARHPLRLWRCAECALAQLPDAGPEPAEPRGVEPQALVQHARDCVAAGLADGWLRPGDTVREFGSPHGGSWLPALAQAGLRPVHAGRADVVVDVFGLMHEGDLRAATAARVAATADDGCLVLVFPPLETVVARRQWSAVRHGHHTHPSTAVAAGTLTASGLDVVGVSVHPLYGGTTTLVARRPGAAGAPAGAPAGPVALPPEVPLAALRGLGDRVAAETAALRTHLESARAQGRRVLGYGAASRAVPLLVAAGIGPGLLAGVADASPAKQGLLLPGTGIPVVGPGELVAAAPQEVLLFLPDLLPEVRRALPAVEAGGGRWVPVGEVLAGPVDAPAARPDGD